MGEFLKQVKPLLGQFIERNHSSKTMVIMSSMKSTILAHIQEEFGSESEQIKTDTPLLSSGIIDSISALELVEFLESTFAFEFQAHEVDQENLDTVDRIETFVLSKKAVA